MPAWTDTKCDQAVPGSAQHCPACHRSFGGTSLGDTHRSGPWDARVCLDPATLRRRTKADGDIGPLMEQDEHGVWRAWTTPEEKQAQVDYWAKRNAATAADPAA